MSQGKFNDTLIRLEAFKNIYLFSPRFLVKNDQILKSAFFTPLCP